MKIRKTLATILTATALFAGCDEIQGIDTEDAPINRIDMTGLNKKDEKGNYWMREAYIDGVSFYLGKDVKHIDGAENTAKLGELAEYVFASTYEIINESTGKRRFKQIFNEDKNWGVCRNEEDNGKVDTEFAAAHERGHMQYKPGDLDEFGEPLNENEHSSNSESVMRAGPRFCKLDEDDGTGNLYNENSEIHYIDGGPIRLIETEDGNLYYEDSGEPYLEEVEEDSH